MATDIIRARESLEAGRKDEALVLLWNAVEPARLAGDEDVLREVTELARSVPGREVESLVAATGVEASASLPLSFARRSSTPHVASEELLLRLTDTYGIVDDRAVIIGVVDADMYERARPEQEFTVVVRSDDERYAVVSTARVARGPDATGPSESGTSSPVRSALSTFTRRSRATPPA